VALLATYLTNGTLVLSRTRKGVLLRWSSTTTTPPATREVGDTIVPLIGGALMLSRVGSRDVRFEC
jgi:hypothetical protein